MDMRPQQQPLLHAVCALSLCVQDPSALARVEVTLDFGPERPARTEVVHVPAGATVVDVTRAVAPVEQDWLCCSDDDVWSIDGVGPDPRLDRYWAWTLDGRGGPDLPARHKVQDGARIGWRYGAPRLPEKLDARIVSLLPAATEIVLALGGDKGLVGVSHLCAQPPGAPVPRVMSTSLDSDSADMRAIDAAVRRAVADGSALYTLDEDTIQAARPTVVFSQGLCPVCAVTPETVEASLPPDCARLVTLTPRSLADIAANIREVGGAIGREHAGRVAARLFERRLAAVGRTPELPARPRVVVLEWFEPLWVSGEWIAELITLAGGEPLLVGPGEPSRPVTWDELAAADPDVILLAGCSMTIPRTERELHLLRAHPAWSRLCAVQSARTFILDAAHHLSSPGPHTATGAEHLAALLRALDAPDRPGAWRRVDRP